MGAKDERHKATERGIELTAAELELEDLREAFHKDRGNRMIRAAFRDAQRSVRAQRQAARLAREAAGPPADATEVKRDARGKAIGWTTAAGDAVAAPGGVSG